MCALEDFFFNDPATTEIYTLSLHDALPILAHHQAPPAHPLNGRRSTTGCGLGRRLLPRLPGGRCHGEANRPCSRSEEHTSELQSRQYLVCRLLLEKTKIPNTVLPASLLSCM